MIETWVRDARSMYETAAAASGDNGIKPFVEEFGLARMEYLRAAVRGDDQGVKSAGRTMIAAAENQARSFENPPAPLQPTPENASAFLDWSKKCVESDALLNPGKKPQQTAVEAHKARLQRMAAKLPAADPQAQVAVHMLKYALAEADYQLEVLK